MDPNDQYFTQTIVGAPMTAFLGRRGRLPKFSSAGLEISLRDGRSHLSPVWGEWLLVRHLDELVGKARGRPGKARRWIERHCLLIAAGGTAMALFAVGWTIFVR
jgi:hypothetical protein